MPIYEYSCDKCGNNFEKLVMAGEQVHCPKCDSTRVNRQMSAFSTGLGDWGVSQGSSSLGGCGSSGGFS